MSSEHTRAQEDAALPENAVKETSVHPEQSDRAEDLQLITSPPSLINLACSVSWVSLKQQTGAGPRSSVSHVIQAESGRRFSSPH